MSCETRFFKCEKCGNILGLIVSSGVTMDCCGAEMVELKPNTVDAAQEKHVPVVTVSGNKVTVQVGSVLHPMLPEHYIMWVYLQTERAASANACSPADSRSRSSPSSTTSPSRPTSTAISTAFGKPIFDTHTEQRSRFGSAVILYEEERGFTYGNEIPPSVCTD